MPTHATVDGDRASTPGADDVRHQASALPTADASVNAGIGDTTDTMSRRIDACLAGL
jgi:hypothetical protein